MVKKIVVVKMQFNRCIFYLFCVVVIWLIWVRVWPKHFDGIAIVFSIFVF